MNENNFEDHMLTDDNAICDCDECILHGWHGNKVPRQKTSIFRAVMESSLLLLGRHNSKTRTMALFCIIEEEWDSEEKNIVWAREVFTINCFWIFQLIMWYKNRNRHNARP